MECHSFQNNQIVKLTKLLSHPISHNQVQRQKQLLDDIVNCYYHPYLLNQIPFINVLLNAFVDDDVDLEPFEHSLQLLLKHLQAPPFMTKSSEILQFENDLRELFTNIGLLIQGTHLTTVQSVGLDTILELLRDRTDRMYCTNSVPAAKIKQLIQHSQLPGILAKLTYSIEEEIYPKVVEIMWILAKLSVETSKKLLAENAIGGILYRLESICEKYKKSEACSARNVQITDWVKNFDVITYILNELLRTAHEHDHHKPSNQWFQSLHVTLRTFTFNKKTRYERNNLIATILRIFTQYSNCCEICMPSELISDLLFISVAPELVTDVHKFDYKFKMMAVINTAFCIKLFEKNSMEPVAFKEHNIMANLLLILSNGYEFLGHEESCTLKLGTLLVLPKLVPHLADDFILHKGPHKLVKLIVLAANQLEYENTLFMAYLHCLGDIASYGIAKINNALKKTKVYDATITLTLHILNREEVSPTLQSHLSYFFNLLDFIYPSSDFDGRSLEICLKFIQKSIENHCAFSSWSIVDCVHFLWSIIDRFKIEFIKANGIFCLLDLLDSCKRSKGVHSSCLLVILGLLGDLSKDSNSISYMVTWRNPNQTLLPILLNIFWYNGDVFRSKVHVIWYHIHVTHKDVMEISKERFKIWNMDTDEFTWHDWMSLAILENFTALKIAKTWTKIASDLNEKGVELMEDDQRLLDNMLEGVANLQDLLAQTQNNVIIQNYKNEERKEYDLYTSLNEARLSEALSSLHELKYIARCTEKMFQISGVLRKSVQLEQSLTGLASDTDFVQSTTIASLNIADMIRQTVNIDFGIKDATHTFSISQSVPSINIKYI